jgi:predicted DsbA family dithiol-disulfide isomerase
VSSSQQAAPLEVQVWSDYICPFCHVARERMAYLEREHGAAVEWFPFDLHPEYPADGLRRATLEALYGGPGFDQPVREMAEDAGLPYAPNPDVVPNSRRALELTEWARSLGDGSHRLLHAALMDAYWRDGRDITGWDVLSEVAAAAGLDAEAGLVAVETGEFAKAVDDSTAWARQAGITGVPGIVLAGRLLISGVVAHSDLDTAVVAARDAAA